MTRRVAYPNDKMIHELFEAQVERSPEAVAVVCEDRQLTYGELNRRANQLGHYLRKRGVGPEVRVGICMNRSVEMVVGLLGILKAGGAYVPLDRAYPGERLNYMIQDAGMHRAADGTACTGEHTGFKDWRRFGERFAWIETGVWSVARARPICRIWGLPKPWPT